MSSSKSGCAHVFIGGAEHTIVKMPSTCGRGPYARVASLTIAADQTALSSYHRKAKPTNEQAYILSFDYSECSSPSLVSTFTVKLQTLQSSLNQTDLFTCEPVIMFFAHRVPWVLNFVVDVTDLPGYWDEIVDSPPERREWSVF